MADLRELIRKLFDNNSTQLERTNAELQTEIAERQRFEEVLHAQTAVFRSILDSMGDGVVVADENGKFLLFNPASKRILSNGEMHTPEMNWIRNRDISTPDKHTPFPADSLPLVRAICGEDTDDVEMLVRTSDVPKGVLISATGRPLRDSTGRPCGGVVVFRDISERKRAEEALRKAHDQLETRVRERTDALSMANAELKRQIGERERAERARQATENRFRALIEKSLDAVSLVDRDGNILYTSSSAQRVLGYSPEEFNSIAGFDLIHPEDIERARSIVLKALRRSGESLTGEIRVRHKDGTWRWIECVTTNLIDEPSVHAVVVNYRDKTDRKLAEEKLARRADELARINAELEQFAYVASHDMREPLRMIASYLQLLAQRYKGSIDDRADKYIHYAVEGAKRMQELITDLSAYTRVGTGTVSFQSVDCANCVSVAIANLKLVVEESGAQVTWGSLPVVMGEPGQLAQVFQNLIENAIKYRGERPPQIRIIAERNGSNWLFTIADNGIGIDPRFSSRIFRIFQRLHEPDKYPGTGIGLAIVKKIVERHGGKIWVESSPGQGSSFHFTIPCSVSEG